MATAPSIPSSNATYIKVDGSSNITRTPELADVRVEVLCEGPDKAKVMTAFKDSTSEIVALIEPLAPEKADAPAGSAVETEWPVKDTSKPAVKWSTNSLSAYWWWRTSKTKHYVARQSFTVTFHDFAAMQEFADQVTEEQNIEFDGIKWRLSSSTAKALQEEAYTTAILDAKQRALQLLAPLVDSPPRLKPIIINQSSSRFTSFSSTPRAPRKRAGAGGSVSEAPSIIFAPTPITTSLDVMTEWVVLE